MSMRRALVVVLILAVVGGAAALLLRDDGVDCDGYRFDVGRWREVTSLPGGEVDSQPAHDLAEELVACRVLIGADRGEVRELLGAPTPDSDRGQWTYDIGHFGTYNNDFLSVVFDGRDTVRRTYTWDGS